ncbi:SOS response-associated peptidase [Sphingomicrobium nitratireducens]|uniref:SOS response-associated peptidase n=1 Tax=Sphingomicrobium nitratireducens TaxID=2964666 RepID=UPI00223F9D9D|nr:SOS response-associated peptidase family protein [Sphingomicrobium nitratireducens]
MCNLYSMTATVDEMKKLFGGFEGDRANLPSYDEIYPGRLAPVLRREEGTLRLDEMEWGFPGPQAAKGRPVTNVRNLSSPFWRSALNRPDRRCLVPVTRFCEWSAAPDPSTGRKFKHWFGLKDEAAPLFAFAGLWRPGEEKSYFAFLTCAPNTMVGAVHPKAMPVMLAADDHDRWLDGETDEACALAKAFPDETMTQFA